MKTMVKSHRISIAKYTWAASRDFCAWNGFSGKIRQQGRTIKSDFGPILPSLRYISTIARDILT